MKAPLVITFGLPGPLYRWLSTFASVNIFKFLLNIRTPLGHPCRLCISYIYLKSVLYFCNFFLHAYRNFQSKRVDGIVVSPFLYSPLVREIFRISLFYTSAYLTLLCRVYFLHGNKPTKKRFGKNRK